MDAAATAIPTTRLPAGERIPVLGQAPRGRPADSAHRRGQLTALRTGIELGMKLIATAADTEELVGEAIVRRRDDVFLVARLAPWQATRDGMAAACTTSLRRLDTETIDLYLLHGRGRIPLEETVEGFETLRQTGLIRHWGVADFHLTALAELFTVTNGCAAEELVYDVAHRGIEWDLLDGCRERGLPVLAYCPLESRGHRRLDELAARHGVTPAQLALAWLLDHEHLVAVPPCETAAQVEEHRAAVELRLDGHDHALLDEAFPPPLGPQPLERRPTAIQ
jgi:diketogulonate reductase-like aldo/keto reductase